ncbi:invasion associated locus B family protein, partial [Nostoc sp. NIES-2111]
MVTRALACTVLLSAGLAAHAAAQTPQKPPAAKPAQAPAAPAEGGGDKASVQAAPTPPPQPIRTETLVFDNWTVTCREFAPGGPAKSCQAVLQVVQQQEGGPSQVLLAFILGREGQGPVSATLQTPTGVVIAPGVELTLGKAAVRKLAYTACDARCAAVFAFDEAMAKEAAAAESAQAAIA